MRVYNLWLMTYRIFSVYSKLIYQTYPSFSFCLNYSTLLGARLNLMPIMHSFKRCQWKHHFNPQSPSNSCIRIFSAILLVLLIFDHSRQPLFYYFSSVSLDIIGIYLYIFENHFPIVCNKWFPKTLRQSKTIAGDSFNGIRV